MIVDFVTCVVFFSVVCLRILLIIRAQHISSKQVSNQRWRRSAGIKGTFCSRGFRFGFLIDQVKKISAWPQDEIVLDALLLLEG